MKNKFLYIASFISLIFISSCQDFLDIKDQSGINPAIWDEEASAKLYLNNIYGLFFTSFSGESLTSTSVTNLSDETPSMNASLMIGSMTSGSVTNYSADYYGYIRLVNIGLKAMQESRMPTEARNRTVGQLYFFRAWMHWRLINLYGGIPYMKDEVTFESPDSIRDAARHKTSQCIAFLKQDLDSAIANLPAGWAPDEYSRITRAAAAAFKGRVLLFYASPQFTPLNADAAVRQNRWKDAFDANVAARDLCLNDGYGLMDITAIQSEKWPVTTDMNKIFLTKKSTGLNKEVLIVTPYGTDLREHSFEKSVCPGELIEAKPGFTPTWDLVISFPMKDGSLPFQYSATNKDTRTFTGNGGDRTKFYLNRDPRFYSTIAYNGCYYKLEGNESRRWWTYSFKRKNGQNFYGENTTVDKTSVTGFLCRKMVDPTIVRSKMTESTTDWVEMRYAEVLLNLAECAFEHEGNNSPVGMDCLIQIRKRAGIEPGTDNTYGVSGNIAAGFTPVEIVLNERKVELAFEGKRFWDLRRRNMFTDDLGTNILKLNGWKKAVSGYTFGLINLAKDSVIFLNAAARDTVKYETLYKYFKLTSIVAAPGEYKVNYIAVNDPALLKTVETGNYNFFDIPVNILQRSVKVEQTNGWQNGNFDPFE